jgi:hypothetical protein
MMVTTNCQLLYHPNGYFTREFTVQCGFYSDEIKEWYRKSGYSHAHGTLIQSLNKDIDVYSFPACYAEPTQPLPEQSPEA